MKPKTLEDIVALPSLQAAPMLLGWSIARDTEQGRIELKIVETEAYNEYDPASHSYRGVTNRTAPMFKKGGHLYVYFTYGMHYCLNIVTGAKGTGEAVLIRAGEPILGIELMKQNRRTEKLINLANGPGKLTQALGIKDTTMSGVILNKSSITLEPPDKEISPSQIAVSRRIGIRQAIDEPWRFYVAGNPFVSQSKIKV